MTFPVKFKRAGSKVINEVSVGIVKTQEDAEAHIKKLYPSAEIVTTTPPEIPASLPPAAVVDTGPAITPSVAQKTE
jgi:hypothetical protein